MGNVRPAVVCLAAGKSQVLVIQKARELGLAVIAIDRDPYAPGFAFSNERIVRSTYDAKPVITRLADFRERYRLVGVINRSSGPPVVTAAEICNAFLLPGVPPDSARIIVDKSKLMTRGAELGLAAPACRSVSSRAELDGLDPPFPCVVKPSLSLYGKAGVRVVSNSVSLPRAFEVAREVALNGMVNVEDYIPGSDVSLMALVSGGQLHCLTLIDELNVVGPGGVVKGLGAAVPSVFSGTPEQERIIDLAKKAIRVFQLDTTVLNLCCRCQTGGEPGIVGIHLDLGGDSILDVLLPASTRFDVLACIIRTLTGERPAERTARFNPAAIVLRKGEKERSPVQYDVVTASNREDLEHILLSREEELNQIESKWFSSGPGCCIPGKL